MAALPEVIAEARRLFALGFQVIAVRGNKRPWGKDWRRVHTEEEVVHLLEGPDCPAIGFLGGEYNFWIVPVDFDKPEGDAWFRTQCELNGIDPDDFPTVLTSLRLQPDGSQWRGRHRYMTDTRHCLGNSAGPKLAAMGIDLRGAGFTVLPPSPHPSGINYEWGEHHHLADFTDGVPPVPDFLYDAIAERPASEPGEALEGQEAIPLPVVVRLVATAPGAMPARGPAYETRIRNYLAGAIQKSRARLAAVTAPGRNRELNNEALGLGHWAHHGIYGEGEALSALMAACTDNGLMADPHNGGPVACRKSFYSGWNKGLTEPKELAEDPPRPGFGATTSLPAPEWPRMQPSASSASTAANGAESGQENQTEIEIPLQSFTPQVWADRDIPPADFLLGDLFSTTSRVMIGGPTGLGKTQLALMMAFAMAAGRDFLHWASRRSSRVLYLDGEMSRRLAKERIVGAIKRFGSAPDTLVFINKEDFEAMPPLNSEAGQTFVDHLIGNYGPFDFLIADNIQAWCPGDLKSPESWELVLPWIRQLTKRSIGQLWIHHTGHETDRLYGDKSREWQLDTVGLMTKPKEPNEDRLIEFSLEFSKARERSPANRSDFDPVSIWLTENEGWQSDRGQVLRAMVPKRRPVKVPTPTPLDEKFYEALAEALASPQAEPMEASAWRRAATLDNWRASCVHLGLIDKERNKDSFRSMMSKYRGRLIDLQWIAIRDVLVWSIKEGSPLSEKCDPPTTNISHDV